MLAHADLEYDKVPIFYMKQERKIMYQCIDYGRLSNGISMKVNFSYNKMRYQ